MSKNLFIKEAFAVASIAFAGMFSLSGCGDLKTDTAVADNIQNVSETENAIGETKTWEQTDVALLPYTFTDDLEREVTVVSAERVVTMIGSFTDIWNLAGGPEVVATANDSWTSFDFALSDSVINFGSHTQPDVEQIIAATPDFIIASANTDADINLLETFEDAGITVAYFAVSNFDDYLDMLKICTDITGRADLYEQNGLNIAQRIEEVRQRVSDRINEGTTPPTVLFLRASATSVKAKGSEGSVGGEILADLGCINIADSDDSLLDDLSLEAIIAANPDYIFITTQGTDEAAIGDNISQTLTSNPAWSSLDAVQENRYFMLEKELYNLKPNAKWADAYEKLEEIIYGE